MATVGIVNGLNLRLYIGGVAVARATNCKFSSQNQVRKTAHKDQTGGFASNDYGEFSGTLSSDFLIEETAGGLSDLLDSHYAKTKVAWVYGTGVTGDTKISGTAAVIDKIDVDATVNENSTGSISLVIDGTITVGTYA